jgi:hypothetical protein
MLGGKIEINQFQNHIDHVYPNDHWIQPEWQRIKNDILEALKTSHNKQSTPCCVVCGNELDLVCANKMCDNSPYV